MLTREYFQIPTVGHHSDPANILINWPLIPLKTKVPTNFLVGTFYKYIKVNPFTTALDF